MAMIRETSGSTTRLRLIAGYYRFGAVLGAVAMTGIAVTQWDMFRHVVLANPVLFAVRLLSLPVAWWTGELIGARQRTGAYMALTSLAISVVSTFATNPVNAVVNVGVGLLGLLFIGSIWRELE